MLITIETHDNRLFGTSGSSNTQDHIFLLSLDEADQYFTTDEAGKSTAPRMQNPKALIQQPGYYPRDEAENHDPRRKRREDPSDLIKEMGK